MARGPRRTPAHLVLRERLHAAGLGRYALPEAMAGVVSEQMPADTLQGAVDGFDGGRAALPGLLELLTAMSESPAAAARSRCVQPSSVRAVRTRSGTTAA